MLVKQYFRKPRATKAKQWSVSVATAALVIGISSQTLAQSRISNDNVKIGVLTDMSSLYSDNSGPGSVAAAQMGRPSNTATNNDQR